MARIDSPKKGSSESVIIHDLLRIDIIWDDSNGLSTNKKYGHAVILRVNIPVDAR
jgi:hypothetical protein